MIDVTFFILAELKSDKGLERADCDYATYLCIISQARFHAGRSCLGCFSLGVKVLSDCTKKYAHIQVGAR
jgi:hypothetical protein